MAVDNQDQFKSIVDRYVMMLYTRESGGSWELHKTFTKRSIAVETGIPYWNVPVACHTEGCAEIYAAKLRRSNHNIMLKLEKQPV